MCGIAGIIDKKDKLSHDKKTKIVGDMLRIMKHRGGDANGVETRGPVSIGHTRLSIVDMTSRANQPISDENLTLSFNGEIYNHLKLRNKYCKNKEITSHSDTITLFSLINSFPLKKVVSLIQGMYAFSLLDEKKKTLSLVLDRFAVKPLYYINTPDFFVWASEIKAFKALPKFRFEFEDGCLEEYLTFRYISGGKTLFRNVNKLNAGEIITYSLKNNSLTKEQYYKIKKGKNSVSLEGVLESSVSDHLMGDIPVGIQLSGGIDSSLVAFFAEKASNKKLHTFSIGLKDKKWNEFSYSDRVAKILKTNHHKIIFTKNNYTNLFKKLTYHLDEPIVHPNTIPMYLLAKEARKYTKVMLTGEGADEFFYGYNRYLQKNLNSDKDVIFSNSFSNHKLISSILKKPQILSLERQNLLKGIKNSNVLDKTSYYDIYTYLPHVLLRQDKAGMAANIENRVPFIYNPVSEYGFNLKDKIGKYGGKTELKEIALKYLPEDLVLRRKCGFGLPVSDWLRDSSVFKLQTKKLLDHSIIKKYFNIKKLSDVIDEHMSKKHDNSGILFSLISLVTWYDIFIKQNNKSGAFL